MATAEKEKQYSSILEENRRGKRTELSSVRRELEAGGVPLEIKDMNTSAGRGSGRRRRPKKLAGQVKEKEISPDSQNPPDRTTTADKAVPSHAVMSIEVEELKSKVREIEAQVQEILLRPQGPTKSARRRLRNQKLRGHKQDEEKQAEANENVQAAGSEARVELERLQKELAEAQNELACLRAKRSTVIKEEEGDVEDIPRLEEPSLEAGRLRPLSRSVTLSGNYKIPIPIDVSFADLDAIGKGIRTAQSIARSVLDAHKDRPLVERAARDQSSESWSEWLGGYSVSIARAVNNLQLTSNMQTASRKPAIRDKVDPAPPRRRPPKLEVRSKKRLELQEAGRSLSETQVEGLLA